jgi:hypothetical protein
VHLVTSPHPTLVAPLATSVGGPTKVPPSSLWPTVVHQKALVLWELVQEASEASRSWAQEMLVSQAQEALMMQVLDESGASLL